MHRNYHCRLRTNNLLRPDKKATAAVHAGWRGTCDRIAEKAVRALIEAYGCNPTDIIVTIGPSISGEVYEVGNEVIDRFEVAGFDSKQIVTIKNGLYFLDLWRANQQALENIGILNEHIEVAGICTYTENDKFFSARRLGIKSGRIFSGIMIKSKDLKV